MHRLRRLSKRVDLSVTLRRRTYPGVPCRDAHLNHGQQPLGVGTAAAGVAPRGSTEGGQADARGGIISGAAVPGCLLRTGGVRHHYSCLANS